MQESFVISFSVPCRCIKPSVGRYQTCKLLYSRGEQLMAMYVRWERAARNDESKRLCSDRNFFIISWAITDRCYGQMPEGPVTTVFTKLAVLARGLFGHNQGPGGSRSNLLERQKEIKTFEKKGSEIFQKYQSSNMKATKWHMLDHNLYDWRRLGDMAYMIADFYKASHRSFKRDYKRNWKRLKTAMKEWFCMRKGKPLLQSNKKSFDKEIKSSATFFLSTFDILTAKGKAADLDEGSYVRHCTCTSAKELYALRYIIHRTNKRKPLFDHSISG